MKPLLASLFFSGVVVTCLWAKPERVEFKGGATGGYLVETTSSVQSLAASAKESWLHAQSELHPDQSVELGGRIVLQLKSPDDLQRLIAGTSLQLSRTVNADTFILEAPDALTAMREAQRLAGFTEVVLSAPVMRHLNLQVQSAYAPKPNDTFFTNQWYLENRNSNAISRGVDLNIRSAWPVTRGENVVIGIADQAVETTHPDLATRSANALHYNFVTLGTDLTLSPVDIHATPVAGLAVADYDNGLGISGVAPRAQFANWRIFSTNSAVTSDDRLMDMFQYMSNNVPVQNHSWGSTTRSLYSMGPLANIGIANAISRGRGGRGTVMIRGAGNHRTEGYEGVSYIALNGNANDDGYCADQRVIVVAAVRSDGRVTRYSNPGACVLIAAPDSESRTNDTTLINTNFPPLLTTARNETYGTFLGTSGSTPEISGLAALLLSANTNLTYRDVQQILVFSARHFDLSDPDLTTNAAGFVVSHNAGFGVPDAGVAVRLATQWTNRPALTKVTFQDNTFKTIPDMGFSVRANGAGVPVNLLTIAGLMAPEERHPDLAPGEVLRPDTVTASLPLVDVGSALALIALNLTNKGALILRGGDSFYNKIKRAELAGASFAIIYNPAANGDTLGAWTITNFVKIPSVLIGQTLGNSLLAQAQTNANLRAQVRQDAAVYSFNITNQMLCEHIGVKVRTDNLRRADVRITLVSPQGTRSILQRVNKDPSTNAPIDWTYITTHDFFESSYGTWTVNFSDEVSGGNTGVVQQVELQLYGTTLTDSDHDGLTDSWETTNFGNLAQGAQNDSDKDGYNNMREQIMGTNPNLMDVPFKMDLSRWDAKVARLSWPGSTNYIYDLSAGTTVTNLSIITNITGQFPETEWVGSYTNAQQFFRLNARPRP